jgi:hypothetical protein
MPTISGTEKHCPDRRMAVKLAAGRKVTTGFKAKAGRGQLHDGR